MITPMAFTAERPDRAAARGGRAGRLSDDRLRVFLGRVRRPGARVPDARARQPPGRARTRGDARDLGALARAGVSAAGMRFVAAPEYPVFPTRERPLQPYEAVVRATGSTREAIARAAARRGRARHPHARPGDGRPSSSGCRSRRSCPTSTRSGARAFRPTRSARGRRAAGRRALWRAFERPSRAGCGGVATSSTRPGAARARPGGAAARRVSASELCIVGDIPGARVPAALAAGTHVVGPLLWEPPCDEWSRPGRGPARARRAVDRAGSRARLLRAALAGLAGEPVRVLAASNRRPLLRPAPRCRPTPDLSIGSPTRARCRIALVICHAGHGTMARALACGSPGAGGPPLRRHGRERCARRLGGGRSPAALATARTADAAPRGAPRARRSIAARASRPAGGVGGGKRRRDPSREAGRRARPQPPRWALTNSISSGSSLSTRSIASPEQLQRSITARPA